MTQDTAETRQLISGKGEEHPATEPDGGEHPARSRDFASAMVNNIRLVRQDFEPQPFPDSFFKRPVVVAFVVLYAITGVGVPLYLFRSHYDDLRGSGDAHSIFEDDWHKHRVAKAYLCFIPATLLAIPVFSPALATASVMPYLLIVVFAVKEAVNQVVKDDFKHFLIRALSNLLATLCALSYLRFMDYLDHIVHQIMVCEHSLLEEKPVKKMKGILHSVGLTRTGNPTADKFMAASTHNRGIADVVYEKVWHPLRSGSNIVVVISYISYTLVSEYAGAVLVGGFVYYFVTAACLGYKFWDQAVTLIKIWTHRPFFVGDLVTIERMGRGADIGIDGFVEHVTLSHVLIRTFDYKQIYQEGKKHTDTINRRLPGKYAKIWEVGGKTKTQKIWENMGNIFICVYLFVCPNFPLDKLGPETPGNVSSHLVVPKEAPGSFSEMRLAAGQTVKRFSVDAGLSTAATATAKAAAELLRDHCPAAAPQWKVKVMDYGAQEVRQRALEHYAIPDGEKNSSFFDSMYINTMALDENFQAKSQYVYHMDAQWRLYRSNFSRSTPNFIEKAVSLMKADSRVYMASVINTFNLEPQKNPYNKFAVIPGSVHGSTPIERVKGMLQGWSKDQWLSQKRPLRGEAFHGRWEDMSDEASKKIALFKMNWEKWGGIVTRHQFLMDTQRFKSLFPLEEWDTAAEHMWSANMNKKMPDAAFQIYFNETVGVFAGPSEA